MAQLSFLIQSTHRAGCELICCHAGCELICCPQAEPPCLLIQHASQQEGAAVAASQARVSRHSNLKTSPVRTYISGMMPQQPLQPAATAAAAG